MTRFLGLLTFTALMACTGKSEEKTALATRLANEAGPTISEEWRESYITCGEKAFANLPNKKIKAALAEAEGFAIWEILGSDALDQYVKVCREAELRMLATGKAPTRQDSEE